MLKYLQDTGPISWVVPEGLGGDTVGAVFLRLLRFFLIILRRVMLTLPGTSAESELSGLDLIFDVLFPTNVFLTITVLFIFVGEVFLEGFKKSLGYSSFLSDVVGLALSPALCADVNKLFALLIFFLPRWCILSFLGFNSNFGWGGSFPSAIWNTYYYS